MPFRTTHVSRRVFWRGKRLQVTVEDGFITFAKWGSLVWIAGEE